MDVLLVKRFQCNDCFLIIWVRWGNAKFGDLYDNRKFNSHNYGKLTNVNYKYIYIISSGERKIGMIDY